MSRNLYVVPFFGIGRRVTLDVQFRYRSLGESTIYDTKVVEYDHVWSDSPFEGLPELVDSWASAVLNELEIAQENGFHLTDSKLTIASLKRELESVRWLVSVGYSERESAVNVFLRALALCNPAAN